jgi:hypothetical protein
MTSDWARLACPGDPNGRHDDEEEREYVESAGGSVVHGATVLRCRRCGSTEIIRFGGAEA